MAKMYAKTQIILPGDVIVPKGAVFDANPAQARQFDHLNAAHAATAEEVKAAAEADAIKNGTAV
ncbi:hypothetical protein LV780_17025 [Cereibacter azotoformans]|uniref:Uncharacterized protein n=1 Tax=Cereibacter azotoformans TaxID=43057 RepID=A0A2T5JPV2_9RHOB|nr:hypothetical protein [Cereibacter azotoformans]AXQ95685.1 hypothetical protein D0Z66_18250 [Cereibacter sphaeroides]PTR09685.1 hypothetical protein C8J28_1328 [Cereibacter azotoformans]UIJ32819.1 hypothetical protein LV780_17025 [Cereibacter azotoformans]